MTEDFLQKFMFEELPVKGSLVRLSQSWREVIHRARPHPEVQNLLGETLCASALLTSNIKFQGAVSLQIQSQGSLRLLLGQCTTEGRVRGVARMREGTLSSDPDQAILAINLEPQDGGIPYQGIIQMNRDGLVSSLEGYFLQSEQLATRFWLFADARQCSGLMLQKMPAASPDPDAWNRLNHLAASLSAHELQTYDSPRLIRSLFHQDNVRLFDASGLAFGCSCSESKVLGVLFSLGYEEMHGLIEERGLVEVCCEYCGRAYQYDRIDVGRLFSGQPGNPPVSPAIH